MLAYDGLATFEFGIAVEVFGLPRPELGVPWYDFTVCAVQSGLVTARGGIRVEAPGTLRHLARADTIVIPGWCNLSDPPPSALVHALRRAHANGARILTICSGAFLVAATGLLDGKRATTHWMHAEALATRYPRMTVEPDVLFVDEGQILTSAGSAAGIDLCLHVVRADYGARIAGLVARRMVMAPQREGGQAQYAPAVVAAAPQSSLAPLLEWMQARIAQPLTVTQLARRAGMSPRTFARRFRDVTGTTPHRWIVNQRVMAAQTRLEESAESIERVAESVGLQTAATLRHHFARVLGTSPSGYRSRFTLRRPSRVVQESRR